jgi:hypothetical protein
VGLSCKAFELAGLTGDGGVGGALNITQMYHLNLQMINLIQLWWEMLKFTNYTWHQI